MQKVLTSKEMREVDRLTTERYGIPSILLMENAAHAVARVITEKSGGSVKGKSILILCGKGNNGGDGAALARILWTHGADVILCLIGKIEDTKADAHANFDIAKRIANEESPQNELFFEQCSTIAEFEAFQKKYFACYDPEVIVDALYGTGLTSPLHGLSEDVAGFIRAFKVEGVEQGVLVVSVDIPSGVNANSSEKIGVNPHAHLTVTFTAPKPGNVLPPASNFNGELVVANIGSPYELVVSQRSDLYLSDGKTAAKWLGKTGFSLDSYKNKRGHALIIAGSSNYTGAAVLCGNAAIRSGVGLVTLSAPRSCKAEIGARLLPEVILSELDESSSGEISENAFAENKELIRGVDAIAVGSGISANDPGMKKFVGQIVDTRQVPVIIDAGALWFYSPFVGGVSRAHSSTGSDGRNCPLILTPHEGEFLRLLGTTDKAAIKDRVAAVREFATKHEVILVLKGERVLIGEPGGKVVVNPTGNSGLGKAGNGDTLTGILAGFVAQAVRMDVDIFETVVAAVYVAGMAGDIAEQKYGKRVMTASDVRESLAAVFQLLENGTVVRQTAESVDQV